MASLLPLYTRARSCYIPFGLVPNAKFTSDGSDLDIRVKVEHDLPKPKNAKIALVYPRSPENCDWRIGVCEIKSKYLCCKLLLRCC